MPQAVQVNVLVAAMDADQVPAMQLMQAVAPAADHVPCKQDEQAPLLAAPANVEKSPAGQSRQLLLSLAARLDEYVPAAQLRQVSVLVAPATEDQVPAMQFVHAVEPDRDQVPAKHVEHDAALPAALAVELVPAAHFRQTLDDVAAKLEEYMPGTQFKHVTLD